MFPVFDSLKGSFKRSGAIIDNNIFKLHYRFTVVALIAFSLLVTSKQYFGDPIDCINSDDIPGAVLKTFCWIHATFSLPSAFDKKFGDEVPYPGVDKSVTGEERIYHKYYQWVCFVLFLQAVFFYLPRFFWKMWEGGRIKNLILGLNAPVMDVEKRDGSVNLLVDYLKSHMNRHNIYAYSYVLCELMNFINVIGQMFLLNKFLGGEFTRFGIKVVEYSETEQDFRRDPMVRVFPRMTKCTFYRYGPSGDVQRHDAFCILPLNIINEKIYIFLWFWFVILAILSGLVIVYRVFIILVRRFRYLMLRSTSSLSNVRDVENVHDYTDFGDWFVLYVLSKNLDPLNMKEVFRKLGAALEGNDKLLMEEKGESHA